MRPASLLPDLGARGFDVRLDVLLVLILVGHDVFVALRFGVGFGQIDGAVAQAGRGTEFVGDDFEVGAGDLQQTFFSNGTLLGTMASRR